MVIICPACQVEFKIMDEEPDIRGLITCPHCQRAFEVTWLYPLTLDYVEDNPLISNPSG